MGRHCLLLCLAICISTAVKAAPRTFTWNKKCPTWNSASPASCWDPAGIPGVTDTVVFPSFSASIVNCTGSDCHGLDNATSNASPQPKASTVTYAISRKVLSEDSKLSAKNPESAAESTVTTLDGVHAVISVGSIIVEDGAYLMLTSNVFLELNGPGVSKIYGEVIVNAHGYAVPDVQTYQVDEWFTFGGLYGKGNLIVAPTGRLAIMSGILAGSYPYCSDYASESQTTVYGSLEIGGKSEHAMRSTGIFIHRLIDNYGKLIFSEWQGSIDGIRDFVHWGAFWGLSAGYCPVAQGEWGAMTINNRGTVILEAGAAVKMHRCSVLNNFGNGTLQVTVSGASHGFFPSNNDTSGLEKQLCDIPPSIVNNGHIALSGSGYEWIMPVENRQGASMDITGISWKTSMVNYGKLQMENCDMFAGYSYHMFSLTNFAEGTLYLINGQYKSLLNLNNAQAYLEGAYVEEIFNSGHIHYDRQSSSAYVTNEPTGYIYSGKGSSIETGTLNNTGSVQMQGQYSHFEYIYNSGKIAVKGKSKNNIDILNNTGSVDVTEGANLIFYDLYNNGTVVTDGSDELVCYNHTYNTGHMSLKTRSLMRQAGRLENTGTMILHSHRNEISSNVTNLGNLSIHSSGPTSSSGSVVNHGNLSVHSGGPLTASGRAVNHGDLSFRAEGPFTSSGAVDNRGNLSYHADHSFTASGETFNRGTMNLSMAHSGYFESPMDNRGKLNMEKGDVLFHGVFSSHDGELNVAAPAHLGLMSRHIAYFPGYMPPPGYDAPDGVMVTAEQGEQNRKCWAGTAAPEDNPKPAGVAIKNTRVGGSGRLMVTSPLQIEGTTTFDGGALHIMMDRLTALTGGGDMVIAEDTKLFLGVNSMLGGTGALVIHGEAVLEPHVNITLVNKVVVLCATGDLKVEGHLTVDTSSSIHVCDGHYEITGRVDGELSQCDAMQTYCI